MIKIVCPTCESDNVKYCKDLSYMQNLYFQCNEKDCEYNEEYVFNLTNESIKEI